MSCSNKLCIGNNIRTIIHGEEIINILKLSLVISTYRSQWMMECEISLKNCEDNSRNMRQMSEIYKTLAPDLAL